MNKFVLLAVVCLLGTAVADTRFRRGILPGDPRYNAGNSGYNYNPPSSHAAPVSSQPSRSYLQPVQEVKQVQTFLRQEVQPSNAYLAPATHHHKIQTSYSAPIKAAPVRSYQVEQIRSVERPSFQVFSRQTYAAPQQTYGIPAQSAPVLHQSYGAPSVNRAPQSSIPVPDPAPHQSYGAPAPQTSYVVPAARPSYVAPAPQSSYVAPAPQQSYVAPARQQSYVASAEVPHQTYGTPVQQEHHHHHHHQVHSVPVQQVQSAPVAHHAHHEEHQHHVEHVEDTLPAAAPAAIFRDVHHHEVHHHEAPVQHNAYIPPVETETVSIESNSNTQEYSENGGYVY